MKSIAVVVGLAGLVASAAHAQAPPAQAPLAKPAQAGAAPAVAAASPAPAAPAPACSLTTKVGDQYLDAPLAGFDPASPAALPKPPANAQMVVCNRPTIVPQVTDYRVLTEMRLPLAIKDGKRTLLLGAAGGKLQIGVQDGEVAPAEVEALRTRIDEMQDAMSKAGGKKK